MSHKTFQFLKLENGYLERIYLLNFKLIIIEIKFFIFTNFQSAFIPFAIIIMIYAIKIYRIY